jgi:hypothetical protein
MLKELTGECEKSLQNIGKLLDEHRALARGPKIALMRWIPDTDKSNPQQVDLVHDTLSYVEQYHHVSLLTWAGPCLISFRGHVPD